MRHEPEERVVPYHLSDGMGRRLCGNSSGCHMAIDANGSLKTQQLIVAVKGMVCPACALKARRMAL